MLEDAVAERAVVVDLDKSPFALLRPVSPAAVKLTDSFWEPRLRLNREVTIPSQYRLCEETGRLDNLRKAAGQLEGPFVGFRFNDSDVYKWLEAAAWANLDQADVALNKMIEETAGLIEAAQQPDGYLNSYYMGARAAERWTNLRTMHELYVAGHFIQAAVAHYRTTHTDKLLQVARRLADLICTVFGPAEEGKKAETDGHPEIEMALVELYRLTGEPKYLKQTQFFLDIRRGLGLINPAVQELKPFRELHRMAGHAVCNVYLNAGATDIYAETGETALLETLNRMWENMTIRQLYITGGIGQRWENEAFGRDHELPNEQAYAETCAAIGSVMWNYRMLGVTGEARYADLLEHTLYNAVLPGLSLDGLHYFYQNPLEDDGTHRRTSWFDCACCPPNVARLLAELPGYYYSTQNSAVYIHLYSAGEAAIPLEDGRVLKLTTRTTYPWDGEIIITVENEGFFSLNLRIPGWCEEGASIEAAGIKSDATLQPDSYVEISREWKPGEALKLSLPMPVRKLASHPYIAENAGRVALMRGPLVYCVEQADLADLDLRDLVLPGGAALTPDFRPDLLGGVVVLTGEAAQIELAPAWNNRLYRTFSPETNSVPSKPVALTAIPYYAWANREPGQMRIWLRSH